MQFIQQTARDPTVREGSREAVTLFLEASALYRALDSSSDEEDSENEWEDPRVLHDILTARYWQRRSVAKFSQWTPGLH
ncbi:unnamed protein product [Phytophthora fragariaefolia]|uniref:Unnamed protein product n=1 Tax=Phytophthora fragariaefolia TaxID=1490495 RepID=A0A9W6XMV4_9STRA|nr:unnamed protein product [Phytophthora fragariaefolia]